MSPSRYAPGPRHCQIVIASIENFVKFEDVVFEMQAEIGLYADTLIAILGTLGANPVK